MSQYCSLCAQDHQSAVLMTFSILAAETGPARCSSFGSFAYFCWDHLRCLKFGLRAFWTRTLLSFGSDESRRMMLPLRTCESAERYSIQNSLSWWLNLLQYVVDRVLWISGRSYLHSWMPQDSWHNWSFPLNSSFLWVRCWKSVCQWRVYISLSWTTIQHLLHFRCRPCHPSVRLSFCRCWVPNQCLSGWSANAHWVCYSPETAFASSEAIFLSHYLRWPTAVWHISSGPITHFYFGVAPELQSYLSNLLFWRLSRIDSVEAHVCRYHVISVNLDVWNLSSQLFVPPGFSDGLW
mgnify:CR=1 FL=1